MEKTRSLLLVSGLLAFLTCLPAHAHTPPALKAENARLKQQVASLTTSVTNLKDQLSGTVTAQQSLKDRLAAAEAQVVTLTAERDEARRIALEATTERDTARQAEAAAISRATLAESAQARQQQIINDLQGQLTTRTTELATAQVTITEQAQVISALQAKQPVIPADWSDFYWMAHAWYDEMGLRGERIRELEAERAQLLETVAYIPLVEQGLRDRLLVAEANAVPNLEAAARIATLEMQLAESESRNRPPDSEAEARLLVEQQKKASYWEWSTRVQPESIRAWEAEHSITPTTGGDEEP